MVQHSMDSESVQTRVVAVSVVGQNVQFYEGERGGGGILDIKHLERVHVIIVGISAQLNRLLVLLTHQPVNDKVFRSTVNVS